MKKTFGFEAFVTAAAVVLACAWLLLGIDIQSSGKIFILLILIILVLQTGLVSTYSTLQER